MRAIPEDGSGDLLAVVCEVRANGETTSYRHAGSGAPVLLLCDATDSRFALLFGALARGGRVIAPAHPCSDDEACLVVDRLAGFLDGLGLASAPVVGAGRAAGPAAAFARLCPDRVSRLVLLGEDVGEPEVAVVAVREALARAD